MSEERPPRGVDSVAGRLGEPLVDRGRDVGRRGRPGEFVRAVLDAPHGEAVRGKVEGRGLLEVEPPDRTPVAAVDDDDERRTIHLGDEPLAELPRVLAVGLDEAAHH